MSVHRLTPLPERESVGRLVIAEAVIEPTLSALRRSSGDDGPHEGLVLWLGRSVGTTSLVLASYVPQLDTGGAHVFVDEAAVGAAGRAARALGLGVIAQVHSHPGSDTRHSDGDDTLVLMPFEGMFSLVVSTYGQGSLDPAAGAGLHQYQAGRWVKVINNDALITVPAETFSLAQRDT
jgi:proteasome lid subunit RPN8/RPN11